MTKTAINHGASAMTEVSRGKFRWAQPETDSSLKSLSHSIDFQKTCGQTPLSIAVLIGHVGDKASTQLIILQTGRSKIVQSKGHISNYVKLCKAAIR